MLLETIIDSIFNAFFVAELSERVMELPALLCQALSFSFFDKLEIFDDYKQLKLGVRKAESLETTAKAWRDLTFCMHSLFSVLSILILTSYIYSISTLMRKEIQMQVIRGILLFLCNINTQILLCLFWVYSGQIRQLSVFMRTTSHLRPDGENDIWCV